MARRLRLGIDTGGTFTDVVVLDEETGQIVTTKTPSTPADPAEGFAAAVEKALRMVGATGADVASVSHGTTVATNSLLEGRLGPLGFITTEGYEFLLEIARQSVPDGYGNSYFWVKPARVVPADLVRAVGGRLDADGAEVRPFDESAAVAAARFFRDRGVTTLGVCFLHSYANPDHEHRMRDVLLREHPDAMVSISVDVLREYREYERAVTTLLDAAVKPRVAAYVGSVRRRLDALAPGVPFHVMRSNGGVLSADEVVAQPVSTVLSGPAAGALGAALVARAAGFDRVLTLDGGGTSTDVSLVLGGAPALTTEGSVGGYPSKIPMVDVATVGAGGGSLARISPEGRLQVGPRSAGAEPGPICYGRGGAEPTVTDAHLVLGRIPASLLGGEIPLDADAAREGVARLAAGLRLGVEECALGILEVSAWNQANALRQVSVQRGLDIRDLAMVSFGGSGSLLACRLLDILRLPAGLVPRDPGNLSAFGLLTVDVRTDYVQTAVARAADLDFARIAELYDALSARAAAGLHREGFPRGAQACARSADLRYVGQAFEVRVPVPDGQVDATLAAGVATAFHDAHGRLYGYSFRDDPRQQVEWVHLRVTGIGPIRRPELRPLPPLDGDARRAGTGSRPVRFGAAYEPTPVYRRDRLAPGDVVPGPAVIEEYGSTVPVHPGCTATVDPLGNLLLRLDPAAGSPR